MKASRHVIICALVAFLAAIAGVYIGRAVIPGIPDKGTELHEVLHHRLNLDSEQELRLEALEREFAGRRRTLEAELRADNARLAAAIRAEHGNGPRVAAAVDASHRAMGDLRKATLAHVFAMRQILRPDQAERFDQAVTNALTAEAR